MSRSVKRDGYRVLPRRFWPLTMRFRGSRAPRDGRPPGRAVVFARLSEFRAGTTFAYGRACGTRTPATDDCRRDTGQRRREEHERAFRQTVGFPLGRRLMVRRAVRTNSETRVVRRFGGPSTAAYCTPAQLVPFCSSPTLVSSTFRSVRNVSRQQPRIRFTKAGGLSGLFYAPRVDGIIRIHVRIPLGNAYTIRKPFFYS